MRHDSNDKFIRFVWSVEQRHEMCVEKPIRTLRHGRFGLNVHKARRVLVVSSHSVPLLALVEAEVLLHEHRQLYHVRRVCWGIVVGAGTGNSFLAIANEACRLCCALEVRREDVREPQVERLEVQTEARRLLVAMVGELRVFASGTAAD